MALVNIPGARQDASEKPKAARASPDPVLENGPVATTRSVLAGGVVQHERVSLGLFGIPLEIVIELLSHGLDTTARLTSSSVNAMDDPPRLSRRFLR